MTSPATRIVQYKSAEYYKLIKDGWSILQWLSTTMVMMIRQDKPMVPR